MRVRWYGTLTFGLVSVPVGLALARHSERTNFRLVHRGCGEPIKQRRVCLTHGELDTDEVGKAYEYAKGQLVEVDESDLQALEADRSRSIQIERFVDAGAVDPVLFEKAYHLVPAEEKAQREGYALLVHAMVETERVAIATYVDLGRDHVAMVRPRNGVLTMHTLCFAEDLRPDDELKDMLSGVAITKPTTDLAVQLIESLAGGFDHPTYEPEYRERVREHVDALVKGVKPAAPKPAKKAQAMDVTAALKASVAAAKPKTKVATKAKR